MGLKFTGVAGLLFTLLRLRKPNRSYIVDFCLLYSSVYSFLLSYVVPVYVTWPLYKDLAVKIVKSKQRVSINDFTVLDDFKINFYRYDFSLSRYF